MGFQSNWNNQNNYLKHISQHVFSMILFKHRLENTICLEAFNLEVRRDSNGFENKNFSFAIK